MGQRELFEAGELSQSTHSMQPSEGPRSTASGKTAGIARPGDAIDLHSRARDDDRPAPARRTTRCAHCDAESAGATAVVVDGHPSFCGPEHAEAFLDGAGAGPRTVYALDLLSALARPADHDEGGLAEHPSRAALAARAEAVLREMLRALVSEGRAASSGPSRAGRRRARSQLEADSLRSLAGTRDGTVVEVRCSQCPPSAEAADRYVDPFGIEANAEEAGLCAWHAHLEAMLLNRQRRAASVSGSSLQPASRGSLQNQRAAAGAVESTRRPR